MFALYLWNAFVEYDFVEYDFGVNAKWYTWGVHKFFRNSRSHLKILSTRRVTWTKYHTEDLQILGTTVHISPAILNSCADDKSLRPLYEPIILSMTFESAQSF